MLFCQYAFYATQQPLAKGREQENTDKGLEMLKKGVNKANNNTCTLLFKPLQRKTKLFPFYILSQTQTSKIFLQLLPNADLAQMFLST